jgi:2-alkyl-3-oxoalkanoate reductase
MRVLVVGASGAIGRPLVRQLVAAGHDVVGTHHRKETADRVRALGATPLRLDLLDAADVRRAVLDAQPDAIIHQATAIGNANTRHPRKAARATTALRTAGLDHLLTAGKEGGVKRYVVQSFGNFRHARGNGKPKSEDEPEHPALPEDLKALQRLEQSVVQAGGIALRYGAFYGAPDDALVNNVQKGRFPIVGDGSAVFSFVHVEDAASATVLALERGRAGVYNVADDEPAPMSVTVPALASALGAKRPRRVPLWIAKLFGGRLVSMMAQGTGLANGKAKRELGWTPMYASWRQGFPAAYANPREVGSPITVERARITGKLSR